MTYRSDWKSDLRTLPNRQSILILNGNCIFVTHTGTCLLQGFMTLKNVMLVPEFKYNLISVSQLYCDLNNIALFGPNFVKFQALTTGSWWGLIEFQMD